VNEYLIYGANGYTGALIAREAARRGHRPILAGRHAEAVAALAAELNLPHRAFPVNDSTALASGIAGVRLVLNCAGPFTRTADRMVEACLQAGCHYLDVTGEIAVFEAMAARDAAAKAAGVMVMPGVGFDVVPSDCLAVHVKHRLPGATRLALGFQGRGGFSRGTLTTMAENVHRGGAIRRGSQLTRVPACWKTRTIDFGRGPVVAMSIPWGDVATAWHSTRIPNIEVYMAATRMQRWMARLSRPFGWLLGSGPMQRWFKRQIQASPPGPTDEQRARGESVLWAEASNDAGQSVVSRLRGPEGYTLTALCGLAVIERVLNGEAPLGYQTPAMAYGPDLILTIPGVVRTDAPSHATR
jgi:short subunit dehydrogenase-like uncharacterized protein